VRIDELVTSSRLEVSVQRNRLDTAEKQWTAQAGAGRVNITENGHRRTRIVS
jgi:DNA-binding protein YbaB